MTYLPYHTICQSLCLPTQKSKQFFNRVLFKGSSKKKSAPRLLRRWYPTSHCTGSHYALKNGVLVQHIVMHTSTQLSRSPAGSLLTGNRHITIVFVLHQDYSFQNEFCVMGVIKQHMLTSWLIITIPDPSSTLTYWWWNVGNSLGSGRRKNSTSLFGKIPLHRNCLDLGSSAKENFGIRCWSRHHKQAGVIPDYLVIRVKSIDNSNCKLYYKTTCDLGQSVTALLATSYLRHSIPPGHFVPSYFRTIRRVTSYCQLSHFVLSAKSLFTVS